MGEKMKQKLDSIGFLWKVNAVGMTGYDITEMLDHLKAFQSEFGHLRVPISYTKDCDGKVVKLGAWVANVRRRFSRDEINEDTKQKLDDIGFVWRMRSSFLEGHTGLLQTQVPCWVISKNSKLSLVMSVCHTFTKKIANRKAWSLGSKKPPQKQQGCAGRRAKKRAELNEFCLENEIWHH